MHKLPFALISVLLLAACVDTTGLTADSSRTPRGNANGAVIVQEFADIQCPACKSAHAGINKPLLDKYGNQVRFEFMHFPLQSIHRFALEAAQAAECAADQGKFWEFVDLAYERQTQLSSTALRDWAGVLGLDGELFDRCVRSEIKEDTVLEDYERGRALGVQGTPTYFVNGKRVESGFDTVSKVIDEALKGALQRL
ncbi:DsbA family protein [Candidatus Peregrinibacteria bacterium]|nr:DsbA family protein [Candidatus Peregrinibacteria bacterium]